MGEVYLNERLEVRGQKFSIAVSNQGWFSALVDGHELTAETLNALRDKLIAATRKASAKLDIHFCKLMSDGKVVPGVVTGVHGANGNLLIRWSDTKRTVQESSWASRDEPRVSPLNADEVARWRQLCLNRQAAEKAIASFLGPRKLDLRKLVERAMKDSEP